MWDSTIKDLGNVVGGKETTVIFTYTGDKTIKSVKSSCGCTVASYPKTATGYKVIGKFTPKARSKEYKKNGNITITFKNNEVQVLKFKSNVQTGSNTSN